MLCIFLRFARVFPDSAGKRASFRELLENVRVLRNVRYPFAKSIRVWKAVKRNARL